MSAHVFVHVFVHVSAHVSVHVSAQLSTMCARLIGADTPVCPDRIRHFIGADTPVCPNYADRVVNKKEEFAIFYHTPVTGRGIQNVQPSFRIKPSKLMQGTPRSRHTSGM